MPRAALYDHTGGPDVLYIGEVPEAEPGPGEVVLRVRAAGLNPFDSKMRSGFVPLDAPFPRRTGSDVAGTVTAVGTGASYADGTDVAVGDEVMGRAAGAVAEQVVAAAAEVTRRPDGVSIEVAGSLWVAGLTAVSCLVTVPVSADDTVLVGGATGAVGLIVSQLAIAAGARVIGTANERNHELLRSLGVEPVAYGEGLADRVAALGQVTAVVDAHGREALDAGVALGVPVKRMVAIAAYGVAEELGTLEAEREARTAENLAKLADDVAAGRLALPIAASFPLDDVVAAYTALDESHDPGKVVVTP
ncbi:NADP-dependent oxidoreductase [Microbacterium horticulturae]|uniref:NADP-dependent oxidoreductase n=1 Tax=Microbacterium horticulturae TaxID=3028316 RepID=A0ABY8C1E0_9MICO|nr:NADP-dependent oxidoreductase [Microbacterium sp. KACC 23027]WEG08463.1 NADP-dependent oxidoreductase [Microbacterium sp. KACC 23027]